MTAGDYPISGLNGLPRVWTGENTKIFGKSQVVTHAIHRQVNGVSPGLSGDQGQKNRLKHRQKEPGAERTRPAAGRARRDGQSEPSPPSSSFARRSGAGAERERTGTGPTAGAPAQRSKPSSRGKGGPHPRAWVPKLTIYNLLYSLRLRLKVRTLANAFDHRPGKHKEPSQRQP